MEMEVVLGIGEEEKKLKAASCSTEIESGKEHDSGEKTVQDDGVLRDNGVRVSVNGDKKSDDDVVEEEKDKEDVEDNEEEEDGDEEEEDEEEEEHGYCVGDFVWGKIKNHPWWPGQIYDPSDASDLALKIKQKGKLLVAYFGDGTFAWCGASQLKPFAESFKECSKVSNSRSFLGAMEEAVEEMGRHIERLLVCDCAEGKDKFDSRAVNNAGIKEGVLVHDLRREMIASLLVGKHGEILKDVKCFAETVSFGGLLELEILKRKVSAFYRSKRGYGLIEYHEPQSVPGLEDKNNSDDDEEEDENVNDGFEWRAKRSSIEEAADLDPEESSLHRSLEKCSGFPDHRLLHRRKEKSIADILENESSAKVRFETDPVNGDVKSNAKSGRKKTKRSDQVNGELENITSSTQRKRKSDASHKHVEESSKGETSRKKKKRDVDVDDDGSGDREETQKNETSDLEIDIDSTPLASLRKKVMVDASSVENNAGNGETATQSSKRERKKSKYLSPDFLSDFSRKGGKKSKLESESSKISSQSQVEEQMADANGSIVAVEEDKLDIPCEPSFDNGLGREELSEELSNAVDFLRLGATPKEMQDLIRLAALGTQYPKENSSREMVREFMTIYRSFTYHHGANHKILGGYDSSDREKEQLYETPNPETKVKEKKDKKRKVKQQEEEIEETGKEENETDKNGDMKKERKHKKSKSKKQADEGEETQKESSESTKKERKRKKSESKKQADGDEETQKEANESTKNGKKRKKLELEKQVEADKEDTKKESSEPTKKEKKRKKPKHVEEETQSETVKPEKKKKKKKREGKSKKKETEKEFAGAELYVTFGPGSSLSKKEDLIEIYERFGSLDKERTDMLDNNLSARVAFLDVADGEKAFESSQEKCPFTSSSTVKFRLKYPNERTEEKKTKAEVAEATREVDYLKKKMDEMRMLLDGCEGGMTEEVRVKFEDEMVNLLEKVRK
ncbi:hypothetical protein CARUB_v10004059mg [Capsella rubella]|uniref:PWWP domain-containing protein n=1 Tax=Capsella rubella TaxID=81985 RepID=R0GXW8_9BRAS|nr:trichohyalin isoform X2 [Capsella rubella]EOA15963.1 hypothetical protein CARUB_v10004059mg [Capsella rubella]